MAELLLGAPVAAAISADLKKRAEKLKSMGHVPTLALIRVGERHDDCSYEQAIIHHGMEIGIRVIRIILDADVTQDRLLEEIEKVNNDSTIHGCLLFRPLPAHLDERAVCQALLPRKDVDCMTDSSLNKVFIGSGEGFAPCTPQSCLEILDYYGIDPAGKDVVVVGRSLVIGRPLSLLLQGRNATVTVCHTKTENLQKHCREAQILVAAAGKAGIVDENCTNPRQVIVDVGINAMPGGTICGDVAFGQVEPKVRAITPVPGGVGAVTRAVLCKHLIEAAEEAVSV